MMYFSRVRIRAGSKSLSTLVDILKNDIYGAHRLLWTLFPGQEKRNFLFREEIAREQLGPAPTARGEPIYYLVSQSEPVAESDSLFSVESKPYRPRIMNGDCFGFDCRVNPVVCRQGKKHDVIMDAQLQFLTEQIQSSQLESSLPAKSNKGVYKKLLLNDDNKALNTRLTELLENDLRYAERLQQISTLSDKLEWAIKAHIDTVLENWLKAQGDRLGFELMTDSVGLSKLQNSAYIWHSLNSKGKKAGFSSVDFAGQLRVTDMEKFEQALFHGIGRSKAFGCGLLLIQRV
ncbi:type I-E CRISPR-associated protein Cas6/Cse3/CasE [Methylobacter sp.]|uniref:type I-E CRISPR-associated protein Cas6/Cse3/CasE n=1 Tax=Methylobacter sp. TaxID=2051955 RepID=UPI003DA529CD